MSTTIEYGPDGRATVIHIGPDPEPCGAYRKLEPASTELGYPVIAICRRPKGHEHTDTPSTRAHITDPLFPPAPGVAFVCWSGDEHELQLGGRR